MKTNKMFNKKKKKKKLIQNVDEFYNIHKKYK